MKSIKHLLVTSTRRILSVLVLPALLALSSNTALADRNNSRHGNNKSYRGNSHHHHHGHSRGYSSNRYYGNNRYVGYRGYNNRYVGFGGYGYNRYAGFGGYNRYGGFGYSGYRSPGISLGFTYVARPNYGYTSTAYRSSYVSDDLAEDVQRALRRQGYYRGPIDGDCGPGTRSAIRAYQYNHRLSVTGRIDRNLLRSLRID